ncbi:MAG: SH3 domain-containing protein [Chloroflexi bacterium]|nr:SH3 domain-containing protein [Chloroflexota bacterium]
MGKNIVVIVVLAVLLVTALPSVSAQDGDSGTIYGIVGVDNAEVRAGPDFAYPIIGRLPRNASVVVLGRAGDFFRSWDGRQWLQIDYGSGTAWVYARLIRTSTPFNSISPTGRILPRTQDGRVPDEFDLTYSICDGWQGGFTQSGNFMAGDEEMMVTYPFMQGANVYSVIVIGADGTRTAFDSETTTAVIELRKLPWEAGVYTWRVAPYWTDSSYRYRWQQICLLRTGGTFEKPYSGPVRDEENGE